MNMNLLNERPPSEEEFRDIVLLSSETMLPNKNTSLRLFGVEMPKQMAYSLRHLDLVSVNTQRPLDVDLGYSQPQKAFTINKLYVPLRETEHAIIEKHGADENYRVKLSRPGAKTIVPKRATLEKQDVLESFDHLDFPRLDQLPEQPSEYRGWMSDVLSRAESWRTKERAYVRKRAKARITASLLAIRETQLYPRGGIESLRGVNYRIEDRTDPTVLAINEEFVGETIDNKSTDFYAYHQASEYYPQSRQRVSQPRQEILLTPLVRQRWEALLTDPQNGTPYETH